MDKHEWFQLNKEDKLAYLEEKLDKLSSKVTQHEKEELEKQIFEIFNWEQQYAK